MQSEWPVEFASIASAGYYVALRVGFAFPLDERNEFPEDWIGYYTRRGLMLRDPAVRWAYENTGSVRWSALEARDPDGVFRAARRYGLNFGVVVSYSTADPKEQKSYGSFARSDREFTPDETSILALLLRQMHDQANPPTNLTVAELEALRLVKEGLRLKEIAFRLGVSEGAIKQRLAGAKRKLGARTNSAAASKATVFRMI